MEQQPPGSLTTPARDKPQTAALRGFRLMSVSHFDVWLLAIILVGL